MEDCGSIYAVYVCAKSVRLVDVRPCLVPSRPLHCFKSLRRFAKAERRGLSCMLCPFFPRSPQRLASPGSSVWAVAPRAALAPFSCFGADICLDAGGCFSISSLEEGAGALPPKIADTDECAHRACLRMADVTVIHSVTTSATGSIATDMGCARCHVGDTPGIAISMIACVPWMLLQDTLY